MIKHTPGPWHRNIKPASHYPVVFAGRNTHVAMVVSTGLPEEEIEANIALIAAAPKLLAALQKLIEHTLHYAAMPHAHSEASRDIADARAAIAAARGEKT